MVPPKHFFSSTNDSLGVAIQDALPEDVSITFVLHGSGGGVWTLSNSEAGVQVVGGEVDVVDCRLECSVEDFQSLICGRLDGMSGYMEGRLAVEGDVGLALRLQEVVSLSEALKAS